MKLSNRALSTGHFLVYPLFLCLLFKYLLTTVLKQHSKIWSERHHTTELNHRRCSFKITSEKDLGGLKYLHQFLLERGYSEWERKAE